MDPELPDSAELVALILRFLEGDERLLPSFNAFREQAEVRRRPPAAAQSTIPFAHPGDRCHRARRTSASSERASRGMASATSPRTSTSSAVSACGRQPSSFGLCSESCCTSAGLGWRRRVRVCPHPRGPCCARYRPRSRHGQPLMAGHGEIDQVKKLFELLGTPDETTWPGCSELYFLAKYKQRPQPFHRLRDRFKRGASFTSATALSDAGLDLMSHMLTLNPSKRTSASESLRHRYFGEEPRPKEHYLMPTFPSSHPSGQQQQQRR